MNPPIFGYRLRYYLLRPWKIVTALWDTFSYFWQRGRHGWAVCDTWRADTYIAEVIAGICAHLATHGTGTPYPFFTQEHGDEAYVAYLKELALAFHEYVCFMESDASREDIGNVRYAQHIERMHHLFDHFAAIND